MHRSQRIFMSGIILIWFVVIFLIVSSINITAYFGKDVKFEDISNGTSFSSGIENESYLVITSEAEFRDVWEQITYSIRPPPEAPYVDFNRSLVIAAFWGAKPNTGYDMQINKITEFEDKIVVYITHDYPEPGGIYGQAIVYPSIIVKIDKTDKPIEFEFKERTTFCGLTSTHWGAVTLFVCNLVATYKYFSKYKKTPK